MLGNHMNPVDWLLRKSILLTKTLLPRNHLASVKRELGIMQAELSLAAPKPIIVRWAPGAARDTFRSSGVSRKVPQRELLFEVTTNGSVTVAAPRLRYTGMYPVS